MGKGTAAWLSPAALYSPLVPADTKSEFVLGRWEGHRVLYPSMLTESWVEGKSVEEKDAQPTERTAALWGLSSKIDSRIWVNFTRNGLRLGSRHQEPPHTDVSRNLGTVVVFLLLSHYWTTDNVRGVLPGLRRRRTGLLPSGPKSNQDPRVWRKGGEAHSPSCMKSSVTFPQSVMIWGAMSSAGVGPLCFWKPTLLHPFTNKFWSTSCFLLLTGFLKMLISFSSRIWHLPTLPKAPKPWLNDHGGGVLDWPANSPDLNPIENIWGIVKRKMRKQETKKCRWAEGHCQRNLGFHTTSAVPQTDHLHATPNWGSN